MLLRERLARDGERLFRYRGYPTLLIIPIMLIEFRNRGYFMGSELYDVIFEACCLALSMVGLFIRIKTIGHIPRGTSGRNKLKQRADALNTTGMYSLVRNPLYVGNFLIVFGLVLMVQSVWFAVFYVFLFAAVYIPIIYREEEFLSNSFGEQYAKFAEETPCIIPSFRRWVKPSMPFNFRMVLRREHDTLMVLVVGFIIIEHYKEYVINHGLVLEWPYLLTGAAVGVLWFVLKSLKRWTHVLRQPLPQGD